MISNANKTGYSMKTGLRIVPVLALGIVAVTLAGCYPPPLATPTPPSRITTKIYDGNYRGIVALTYVAPGAERGWCETQPQVTFTIAEGVLSYAQPHPGYPGAPVVTYNATVTADSQFSGLSDRNGIITGSVADTHVTAQLDGLGCGYSLSGDKIATP